MRISLWRAASFPMTALPSRLRSEPREPRRNREMAALNAEARRTGPVSTLPEKPLITAKHGNVQRLTLSRPSSRNSLSEAMMAALGDALAEAATDRAVHV